MLKKKIFWSWEKIILEQGDCTSSWSVNNSFSFIIHPDHQKFELSNVL